MDQNIFELAKKLADLSPLESGAAIRLIREHGYKHGERASAVIDLAKALISVWDGKASTLDQAAAWQSVWAHCATKGLVRGSLTSNLEEVLTALDSLCCKNAIRDDRAAAWLAVWDYVREAGLLPKYSGHSPVQQVLFAIGDLRSKVNGADSITVKNVISIDTSSFSEADLERLKAAIRSNNPMQVLHTGCVSQEQAEHIAEKYRKSHPEIAALWPTPSSEYSPYNAKPCHPSHELYKTGDADAPEQIKDRNGEVVLDQCRHCRLAESELLDGEPCAKAPSSENYPPELYGEHMSSALKTLATVVEPARLDVVKRLLVLQDTCYGLANNAGWWTDLETGEDVRNWPKKHLDNWVSAKLMLIVTEVAEAMEGHRKGLKDDKLPHRGMLEVELADAVIRIMDLAGGLNMDVAGAIVEKLAYNMSREDHRIENRKAAGGKSV